jgi:hypothetical protein
MNRREFVTLLGGAATAAWPRAARAQQLSQIARIGYLSQESAAFDRSHVAIKSILAGYSGCGPGTRLG